jgi:hypothetical protein
MSVFLNDIPGADRPFQKRQILIAFTVLSAMLLSFVASAILGFRPPDSPAIRLVLTELPIPFVPNLGQTAPEVSFSARVLDGSLFFTSDEIVLALPGIISQTSKPIIDSEIGYGVIRQRFAGARSVEPFGIGQLPGVVSYYAGSGPANWTTHIPTYAGVVYPQLYPGIDLHYGGSSGLLKATFTLAPGARPELIRWHYNGVGNLRVDETTGDLVISPLPNPSIPNPLSEAEPIGGSALVELAPMAWQSIGGELVPVDVNYILYPGAGISMDGLPLPFAGSTATSVGFALGYYDPAYPLTIDPTLSYSTYLGGSNNDVANGIALDSSGNMFIVGKTESANFPGTSGSGDLNGDVFVTKINSAGTAVIYTTYLGGSQKDDGRGIAVDPSGNAYLVGETSSIDFPTINPFQGSYAGLSDGFIAKLTPSGSIAYSTYLGTEREDALNGISVDGSGNAYATGYVDGYFASAVKVTPNGGLSYWVGFGPTAYGSGSGVAIDAQGNAYITGYTNSDGFPVTPDALQSTCGKPSPASLCTEDAFVLKLNAAGDQIIYSTYLGGSWTDMANAIALDAAGNITIAGQTQSKDFPTKNAVQPSCSLNGDNCEQDAFVTKIKADGSALVYSTYLGGTWNDFARGLAVDSTGNAYVVGATYSLFFPTLDPIQPELSQGLCGNVNVWPYKDRECYDAFVAKVNPTGALIYSTYLGGTNDDFGNGIAINASNVAYIVGHTSSTDFPTVQPMQSTKKSPGGQSDVFIARIGSESSQPPAPTQTPVVTPTPGSPSGPYRLHIPALIRNH